MAFTDQIDPIKEAAQQALQAANSLAGLDDVRVQYLGTVSYTHLTLPTICSV